MVYAVMLKKEVCDNVLSQCEKKRVDRVIFEVIERPLISQLFHTSLKPNNHNVVITEWE